MTKPAKSSKMTGNQIAVAVPAVLFALYCLVSNFIGGYVTLYTSKHFRFSSIPDLTGKVAIVTGSNTGIGYVTARELARKGAKVIATVRDDAKGKETVDKLKKELNGLPGASLIEYMKMDLSSLKQVKSFANNFKWSNKKLDILVLNAGVMVPPFTLTEDGFELQIGVNHLAHFLLVQHLLPMIKSSKSRVVTVSSLAHLGPYPEGIDYSKFSSDKGYDRFMAYGQSKLANVLFCNELSKRLAGTGATCNSLHPGSIKTDLQRHVIDAIGQSAFSFVMPLLDAIFSPLFLSANDGALTQLYVATSPDLDGVSGKYFIPTASVGTASPFARNETLQNELWEESTRLVKKFL